jgi:signal transduction histidine kinase
LLLEADRFRLEQVITNLVTNAIKYAPGAPLRVEVGVEQGAARLVVQDGGPGIPKPDQERIFRRFERLVSADEVSGLGIGLYIANEIVRAHRGSMRAEGDVGEGARFVVELPLPAIARASDVQ